MISVSLIPVRTRTTAFRISWRLCEELQWSSLEATRGEQFISIFLRKGGDKKRKKQELSASDSAFVRRVVWTKKSSTAWAEPENQIQNQNLMMAEVHHHGGEIVKNGQKEGKKMRNYPSYLPYLVSEECASGEEIIGSGIQWFIDVQVPKQQGVKDKRGALPSITQWKRFLSFNYGFSVIE